MAAVLENQAKRWTYDEYCNLHDDKRYEILQGNRIRAPAPDTGHQDWSRELFRVLDHHV